MKAWSPERVALAAGARLFDAPGVAGGPERAVIDSRAAGAGTLFFGLRGQNVDGGSFARQALANGAWGVLTAPHHAEGLKGESAQGVVLVAEDPLAALHRLANAWRHDLGAQVIGITGSTGKTSTKDLLLAVLAPHRRTVASRANFNTEIGLPLEILGAPAETEVLVLEMAMRGAGQIAELAEIAEPDVGVIVSIGPVHLELLGTIEAIAAAKAELLAGLRPGAVAIVPANEPLLAPHLRHDLRTITFGEGGNVWLLESSEDRVVVDLQGDPVLLDVSFTQAHLRRNLLAAVAAAQAVGVRPGGRVELALSPGRGQRSTLPTGVTLIDDCYNANPMSMRAALDELGACGQRLNARRRVAVLGDMLELGPSERRYHLEIGEYARRSGVDLLVAVGRLGAVIADGFGGEVRLAEDAAAAAELVPALLGAGDVVLVKASNGVALELVCRALRASAEPARPHVGAQATT
jgi:UDP-N-acetylmuramoyl-tripeptide--D-alanyl-D-alanine ligase